MGNWKGVRLGGHANESAPIELYNLSEDRGESRNVAANHPNIVARIRAVMESRTPSAIPEWNFPSQTSPN